MELMEVIRKRKSVRKYKPDPVPQEDIEYILEAARLAPSWANTQCWHFIVVTDEDIKSEVARDSMPWCARAPVLIVACADPEKPGYKGDIGNYLVDIGIAMEHLILAATERGLGTCWIGGMNEAPIKKVLGVPDNLRVVAMTTVGYRNHDPHDTTRKSLDEIVSYERYGQSKL
ncbi:MAG: nitroreductase family protein [Dehalococcoidia bacterium]|nr:nitroreductase family protein [Dehalococcoidia bacterium]